MRDFYEFRDNFTTYKHVKSDLIIAGKVDRPDISIFIPTYKRAETLKVSIESAINQLGDHNYEIIVVNNDPEGVHGDTKDLLEELCNDKIYYYVNEENMGLCGNWNRGVELSRGQYVAMIHDDDMLSPWFLSSIVQTIDATGKPDIIAVSFVNFDSSHMPHFKEPGELKYREVTKQSYFFGRYINIAGMTVRRDSILKIGGYADEYLPNEDSVLIYHALLMGRVLNIENVLAGYRQEVNMSLSGDTMKRIIEEVEYTRRIIAKHESFARKWMNCFDKEYIYRYTVNANRHWGLSIDPNEIFSMVGLSQKPISKLKYDVMRGLLKLEQARVKR